MSDAVRLSIIDTIVSNLHQRLGEMSPGERLPTVRELMATFGASQFAVQKALGRLRDEGLIDSQVGRGTFVAGDRSLPSKPRTVLLLSYERQSDRGDELTRLMHRTFLERNWRSVILTYADFDQAAEIVESLPRFDACVVQPRGTTVPLSLLAMLKARGQMVMVEGYGVTGVDVDTVSIDWPDAVSVALRHLYDLGHRRIGFVAQSLSLRAFTSTAAEFRRLHAWAGLPTDVDPVIPLATESEDEAFELFETHLRQDRDGSHAPFSAYVVYPRPFHGDRLMRSFANAGLTVPEDVAVVTLGYSDLVHEHVGRFDTVGQSSARVIDEIISGIEARWSNPGAAFGIRFLTPEIVVRGSTSRTLVTP